MITKDVAVTLTHGTTLYSDLQRNSDGSQKRCRVMGKCKTWKRDPERFQLPVKHGLYDSFYIVNDEFAQHWHVNEQDAIDAYGKFKVESNVAFDPSTGRIWQTNKIVTPDELGP